VIIAPKPPDDLPEMAREPAAGIVRKCESTQGTTSSQRYE
jgi:hypothetical protein